MPLRYCLDSSLMDRVKWSLMLLAAILFLGILSMWVPARWALSAFQVAVFALAAAPSGLSSERSFRQFIRRWCSGRWPFCGACPGLRRMDGGPVQDANEVLNWITYLAVFALGLELSAGSAGARAIPERLAVVWYGHRRSLDADGLFLATGNRLLGFPAGSDRPTLGPFVYYNQYAAFIEVVLPLALVRAILDQRRRMLYSVIGALLLASVVAGGSRAGTILCLAEARHHSAYSAGAGHHFTASRWASAVRQREYSSCWARSPAGT